MTDQLVYDIGNARYINLSDRCTLKCCFCPKTHGEFQVHDYDLVLRKRPEADEIINQLGDIASFDEIVFCGFGESTLRLKPLLEIARHIKAHGGKVRVNTDGLANLVHKRNVLPELGVCVDAVSVSLNGQNEEIYNRHCQPSIEGSFQAMLDFLEMAPHYIKEVTATAIDGLDGVDIKACKALAEKRGVAFRSRMLDVVG